jgi:hypothetical protein
MFCILVYQFNVSSYDQLELIGPPVMRGFGVYATPVLAADIGAQAYRCKFDDIAENANHPTASLDCEIIS